MPKKIRHACQFLAGNDKIDAYLSVIERSEQLLSEARRALPPPLSAHCLHAVLAAGVLTLTTDSPVWSSRLRFFAPELARSLAPRYGAIASCRVRIQPPAVTLCAAPAPKHRLSATTKQHLLDTAAGIEDADLAAALRRLARVGSTQA
jgi:hypothetical protein